MACGLINHFGGGICGEFSSGPSVCNVKRRPSRGLCLRISRLDCSELFTRLQDNYTTWCALTGNRPEKKSMKAQDSWMCVDTCKFCFSWNPKPVGNRAEQGKGSYHASEHLGAGLHKCNKVFRRINLLFRQCRSESFWLGIRRRS